MFLNEGPEDNKEFQKIINLPQRDPEKDGKMLTKPMTRLLKTPEGSQELRPLQALALCETYDHGAFICLPVGYGKTLISYLVPSLFKIQDKIEYRCTLLLPASLIQKTRNDFLLLRDHWQSAPISILSYEALSRNPDALNEQGPQILICDEADALKNPKSGVTKRVKKYLKNSNCLFLPMSGTMLNRSISDLAHLIYWSLPYNLCPIPTQYWDLQKWCAATDENPMFVSKLGALKYFGNTRKEVRKNFGKFLRKIPGVITSMEKTATAKINIEYKHIEIPEITKQAKHCRKYWETPSGTEFISALDKYSRLRQISQGFCYEWTEKPPVKWLGTRQAFGRFVRQKLQHSRTLETESQIVDNYWNNREVKNWVRVKPEYKPITKPVWFSANLLLNIWKYVKPNERTLIWVSQKAVGEALVESNATIDEVSYFHEKGCDKTGRSINDYKGKVAIVSTRSVAKGFNLQRFTNNIIVSCPKLGKTMEQILGRTYRSGQEKEVNVLVIGTIPENKEDFEQAKKDALYIQSVLTNPQILCEGT